MASDDDLGSLNGDEGGSMANNTTAIIDSEIQKEAKVEYFSVAKRTLCRFTFARRVAKGVFDVVIVKFVSDAGLKLVYRDDYTIRYIFLLYSANLFSQNGNTSAN